MNVRDLLDPIITTLETGVHTWISGVCLIAIGLCLFAAGEPLTGSAVIAAGFGMFRAPAKATETVVVTPPAPSEPTRDFPAPPPGYGLQ